MKTFALVKNWALLLLGGVAMVLTIVTDIQTKAHDCALTALCILTFVGCLSKKDRDE